MPSNPVRPSCSIVKESRRYTRKVVRGVRFHADRLILDIQGDEFSFAQLVFEGIIGFRVLDERDLSEFWNQYSEPNGWLWEVHSGGWCELERNRTGFSSADLFSDMREFFIVDDKCISVLFRGTFTLTDTSAEPAGDR